MNNLASFKINETVNSTVSNFKFTNLSLILNNLRKNVSIKKNYLNKIDQFDTLQIAYEKYEEDMGLKTAGLFGLIVKS